MTRNDDFDQTLEAWLRREAPSQAPDRVLDAALERVAAQSQQRGWLQRLSGGTPMNTMLRVAAVAAALAFAAFIGYQLSGLPRDNTGTSPEPSPSQAPSGSPTPSASPADAALMLQLLGGSEAGQVHLMTVMEDGRIITTDAERAFLERRLTADGVQLLRDELDATGLTFDASADYLPVPNPGVEPPGYGGAGPSLEVGQPGGGTVLITWFLFGDTEQDYFQPQPEAEALEALLARLTTIDEWLPASAWADATAEPYAPESYRIFIHSQEWGGSLDDLPVEADTVAWPLEGGANVYGDTAEAVTQEPEFSSRCRAVSAASAAPVLDALDAAGAMPNVDIIFPGTSYVLGHRATSRQVTITLEPILPHAEPSCGVEPTF